MSAPAPSSTSSSRPQSTRRVRDCSECPVLLTAMKHYEHVEGQLARPHCWELRPDRPQVLLIKHPRGTTVRDVQVSFAIEPPAPAIPTEAATCTCPHMASSSQRDITFPAAEDDRCVGPADGCEVLTATVNGRQESTWLRELVYHSAPPCMAVYAALAQPVTKAWDEQLRLDGPIPRGYLCVSYRLCDGVDERAVTHTVIASRHTGLDSKTDAQALARAARSPQTLLMPNTAREVDKDNKDEGAQHHVDELLPSAQPWYRSFILARQTEEAKEARRYVEDAAQLRYSTKLALEAQPPQPPPAKIWKYPSVGLSLLLSSFVVETNIVNLHQHEVGISTAGRSWFSTTAECRTPHMFAETINRLRTESTLHTEWRCLAAACEHGIKRQRSIRSGGVYVLHDDLQELTSIDRWALPPGRKHIHNPVSEVTIDWSKSGLAPDHPLRLRSNAAKRPRLSFL